MSYTLGYITFFSGKEDMVVTSKRGSLYPNHKAPCKSSEILLETWMNKMRDILINVRGNAWKGTAIVEVVVPDLIKEGKVYHKQLLKLPFSEVSRPYRFEAHLFKDVQENMFLYVILNGKVAYTELGMRGLGYRLKTGDLVVGTGETRDLALDVEGNLLLRGSPISNKYTKELAEEYFQQVK